MMLCAGSIKPIGQFGLRAVLQCYKIEPNLSLSYFRLIMKRDGTVVQGTKHPNWENMPRLIERSDI